MKRVVHKETGKSCVISDAHAAAMTVGRDAKFRIDEDYDHEAVVKAREEAIAAAARKAMDVKNAEGEEEVSTAKEEKASPKKAK